MEKQCTLLPHTRRIDATFQTPADSSREPFLRDHHCSFNTSLRIPPSSCSTKKAHHPCTPLLRIPLHELIMLHPITPWKKNTIGPALPVDLICKSLLGPPTATDGPNPSRDKRPPTSGFPSPAKERFAKGSTQTRKRADSATSPNNDPISEQAPAMKATLYRIFPLRRFLLPPPPKYNSHTS